MANQIVVSAGAKVRNLSGVLTATSGVVSSLPIDGSLGIPQLDVNGKILVSQLPNSVMEYKGTWNVSTNTPTLVNGVGNQGDVYLVEGAAVGGTSFNFGAGAILFFNGDQAIYSGSIWQRASGATGTVTSVAITESGDSLNITGSPITTSGTINIGFNGTNLQYVNGTGNLTTFPTLITSIGLSMPSAFSVANSPLTANGTIAVTGAGTTAQYIRGDGSLATFPTIATEAQRLITEVYNETGATLTKGTVVYINGGHGNLPTITKAIATGDATSAQTYGIVQTDITNNNNGYVVVIGSLGDLDTQAYANGTQLYLSSTTAGAWTDVKQYAPAHLVYVGIVVRSHPTQGVVEVRIQNGFEMDELHNVSAQSPLNNQGLFYNTSTSLWENKSIATALGYTPANAALVVPYTGATGDVNLGLYSLTSNSIKVIGDNSTYGGTLSIKQSNVTSLIGVGYTELFGKTNRLGISFGAGYIALLSNSTLTAERTYTLPDASGTLALTTDLSGYLPLTGGTLTGSLTLPSNTASGNPALYFNYGANAASRSWRLCNDVESFGDFKIQQSTTQTGSTYADILKFTPTGAALFFSSIQATLFSSIGASSGYQIYRRDTDAYAGVWYSAAGSVTLDLAGAAGTVLNFASTGVATLSNLSGSGTRMVVADSSGVLSTQAIPSAGVTGTGTTNYLPKFTGTSTIGNSSISDNGTGRVSIGTTSFNDSFVISNSGTTGWEFGNSGSVITYNRSTAAYIPMTFEASNYILNRGNLGLGVTPSQQLTVGGRTTIQLSLVASNNTGASEIYFGDSDAVFRGYIGYQHNGDYFQFSTSASEKMRLFDDGNLLIQSGGTFTNAGYKLDVNGTGRFYNTGGSNTLTISGTGSPYKSILKLQYDASIYGATLTYDASPENVTLENYGGSASGLSRGDIRFRTKVNNTTPTDVLSLNGYTGNATFTGSVTATSFFESSDSRLKTLIQDNYQTKDIASITPKLYTKNGKVELGYYAQDFVGVLDSAVSKGSDDMLSLSYREVLVAKVYALEQEIKELKAKMN